MVQEEGKAQLSPLSALTETSLIAESVYRHSSTGHTVTVFGATSFLGRYLVSKLGTFPLSLIVHRDDH